MATQLPESCAIDVSRRPPGAFHVLRWRRARAGSWFKGQVLASVPRYVAEAPKVKDEALMAAYVAGDAEAFRQLFERYAPRLVALGRRHGLAEDEAREMVQQTFLQVHGARFDYKQGFPLRPWIVTIALNLVRQVYRRRTRRKESELEEARHTSPDENAPQQMVREEKRAAVRKALEQLPEGQRRVVELHWFEGQSFAEVAKAVGAKEGAVRVRAHRAYERLRVLLGTDEVRT